MRPSGRAERALLSGCWSVRRQLHGQDIVTVDWLLSIRLWATDQPVDASLTLSFFLSSPLQLSSLSILLLLASYSLIRSLCPP